MDGQEADARSLDHSLAASASEMLQACFSGSDVLSSQPNSQLFKNILKIDRLKNVIQLN
jgi:hypothetical protein